MTARSRAPGAPEGALVVDKPAGPTSHDVVATVRRALGQPRIGHTGTLDPLATGVLPLLLGRATRLAQFLALSDKTYQATVVFGQATYTYDAAGNPVGLSTRVDLDPVVIEAALARFRGRQLQTPPAVSAKKVGGRRAYDLARRDMPVALAPVEVEVTELTLLTCVGSRAELRVTCSAGFYVRALAHDLGAHMGVGAHLAGLRRERSGQFDLAGSVTLDTLLHAPEEGATRLLPMAALLPDWPAVRVEGADLLRIGHGQAVPFRDDAGVHDHSETSLAKVRVVGPDGRLLALAEARTGLLHPVLVLV